jgi:hypothetical protein
MSETPDVTVVYIADPGAPLTPLWSDEITAPELPEVGATVHAHDGTPYVVTKKALDQFIEIAGMPEYNGRTVAFAVRPVMESHDDLIKTLRAMSGQRIVKDHA